MDGPAKASGEEKYSDALTPGSANSMTLYKFLQTSRNMLMKSTASKGLSALAWAGV